MFDRQHAALSAGDLPKAKERLIHRLDAVAAFHLRNGASAERINWLADRSPKGISQSFGLMVNYMYRLTDIELNHETFVNGGKVASSSDVRALLKPRR